jgi:hypothetical protein
MTVVDAFALGLLLGLFIGWVASSRTLYPVIRRAWLDATYRELDD